jgi:hypothetical protein
VNHHGEVVLGDRLVLKVPAVDHVLPSKPRVVSTHVPLPAQQSGNQCVAAAKQNIEVSIT